MKNLFFVVLIEQQVQFVDMWPKKYKKLNIYFEKLNDVFTLFFPIYWTVVEIHVSANCVSRLLLMQTVIYFDMHIRGAAREWLTQLLYV